MGKLGSLPCLTLFVASFFLLGQFWHFHLASLWLGLGGLQEGSGSCARKKQKTGLWDPFLWCFHCCRVREFVVLFCGCSFYDGDLFRRTFVFVWGALSKTKFSRTTFLSKTYGSFPKPRGTYFYIKGKLCDNILWFPGPGDKSSIVKMRVILIF